MTYIPNDWNDSSVALARALEDVRKHHIGIGIFGIDHTKHRETNDLLNAALKAFTDVMNHFVITGNTEAERRFSDGERHETAQEAMAEVLCQLTFEQVMSLCDDTK